MRAALTLYMLWQCLWTSLYEPPISWILAGSSSTRVWNSAALAAALSNCCCCLLGTRLARPAAAASLATVAATSAASLRPPQSCWIMECACFSVEDDLNVAALALPCAASGLQPEVPQVGYRGSWAERAPNGGHRCCRRHSKPTL